MFWIATALLVCLNSASAALVIAVSALATRSVEVVLLGMFEEGRDDFILHEGRLSII